MIVPAVPRHLTEEDVAALRPGDRHNINSGLGGAFTLEFVKQEGDRFVFKCVSAGWESIGIFKYTFDEVRESVYDLIAENPSFRKQDCGKKG